MIGKEENTAIPKGNSYIRQRYTFGVLFFHITPFITTRSICESIMSCD